MAIYSIFCRINRARHRTPKRVTGHVTDIPATAVARHIAVRAPPSDQAQRAVKLVNLCICFELVDVQDLWMLCLGRCCELVDGCCEPVVLCIYLLSVKLVVKYSMLISVIFA